MDDLTDERLQYVRVTNNLEFAFVDRYDGIPVTIEPGQSQNIAPDMAAHFFAYHPGVTRETMLKHVSKRHGWNTPEFLERDPITRRTKAERYFDKIEIKAVSYKLVPADETVTDPAAPIPADDGGADESGERDDGRRADGTFKPSDKPRMTPKRVEVNI